MFRASFSSQMHKGKRAQQVLKLLVAISLLTTILLITPVLAMGDDDAEGGVSPVATGAQPRSEQLASPRTDAPVSAPANMHTTDISHVDDVHFDRATTDSRPADNQPAPVVSGWKEVGNDKYYLSDDGKALTGWQYIDDKWYYFESDGRMYRGLLYDESLASYYFLSSDGAMQTGWIQDGDTWYYANPTGYLARNGWLLVDGAWYCFSDKAAMITGWHHDKDGNWYHLQPSGKMTTGWLKENNTWYYLQSSGAMAHSGWCQVSHVWYYLNGYGEMVTGWKQVDDGNWYHLQPSGEMTTGWLQENNVWYYLQSNGIMARSGWCQVDGTWYYFNGSGEMYSGGWAQTDGKWYLISHTGAWNNNVVDLSTPYYNQNAWGAPMGCEAASLLQALHYKGCATTYNLGTFLQEMPISPDDNPFNGFASTPYQIIHQDDLMQSIFPKPLAEWGSRYGKVYDISGASVDEVILELAKGNPMVLYAPVYFREPTWGMFKHNQYLLKNLHVTTLSGYDYNTDSFKITDPLRGDTWYPGYKFRQGYNALKWVVVVR